MSLSNLFYPKSVALIGASHDAGSVGNEIAKNLSTQGFRGELYFVNPKGGKLYGKKVLKNIQTLTHISLAIVAIPAPLVLDEVKQLILKGTKSIIVISAGFAESGNQNAQYKLATLCNQHNVSLIGPNCLGLLNPEIKLNASFAPIMPKAGTIAFVSQSGALCASVLDYAAYRDMGFSKFISVGNKAQIGEEELLEFLYTDPKTKIIAMYIEELEEAQILQKIAQKITKGKAHKPIVVLKSGKTKEGKKAAMSHTGALGGSDEAYDALFEQSGIIRANTIEELFDIVDCFEKNKPIKNNKVAVITNAGGPGVLTADALIQSGLKLATFASKTMQELKTFLPPAASIGNPVDILGDADSTRYKKTLEIILNDPSVSAVEIILTPQSMTEIRETALAIAALKKTSSKPIIASFMGHDLVEPGLVILNDKNVSTSTFPESAAKALSALSFFSKWQKTAIGKPTRANDVNAKIVRTVINANSTSSQKLLSTEDVFTILNAYKFPTLERHIIKSEVDLAKVTETFKNPLVLKIISPQINHKIDVGGVILNVDPKDAGAAYKNLISHIKKTVPNANITGVEVTKMLNEGLELILGVKTDPKLGKQILVGLGGTYAEVISDVSWGLAPLTTGDINRMIASLKVSKILSGYRGEAELSTASVIDCLSRLSQLICDFEQIAEVDINPLKVLPKGQGAFVLDARIAILGDKIRNNDED